jgi:hypothetical protein
MAGLSTNEIAMTQKSGGGSATTSGTTFQENVAAHFAVLILAEQAAAAPLSLSAQTTLDDVLAESVQPVDDLKVGTSDEGQIFVQAKTTLSLSVTDDTLTSVAKQFVRQFRVGFQDPRTTKRNLTPERDRLVLAVSAEAPGTIRNDLANALDRIRSVAATSQRDTVIAAMSVAVRTAIETFMGQLRSAWQTETSSTPRDDEIWEIVRLVHVLTLDFRPNGHELTRAKDLLRQAVLLDATQADSAWNTIVAVCRNFAPSRTGGNRLFLLSELEKAGIGVRAPQSFRIDITRLAEYTDARLSRMHGLSVLTFRGQELRVVRPVVKELEQFAEEGWLLVVGSPGAGKSGCMYDLVANQRQKNRDVVLIAVDHLTGSQSQLGQELQLTHGRTLTDILANWPGSGPAFLVLDALDAARSDWGISRLLDEFADIKRRAPRWHVVASIREFDLRNSRDIRRLFGGTPHADRQHSHFQDVRHIQIDELTSSELGQLGLQSPDFQRIIDSTQSEFRQRILPNLFNLRLLAELAGVASTATALQGVITQLGLLDLYWEERILREDNEGSSSELLDAAIGQMIERRLLNALKSTLLPYGSNRLTGLNRLLSNKVLIDDAADHLQGADVSISFSHNILFDYAVARVRLQELPDNVISWLSESQNQDLLLAIRPSLVMALRRLWHYGGQSTRQRFWERAIALHRSPTMRLIGKILSGTVAAESFRVYGDIAWLIDLMRDGNDDPALAVLRYTVMAALALHQESPVKLLLSGPDAPEWLCLASTLSGPNMTETFWLVRNLLHHLQQRDVELTNRQVTWAGSAARSLLQYGLSNERASGVVRTAIEVVCRTIRSDPVQSAAVLALLLTDDQVAKSGHDTLGDMTKHLPAIMQANADLALKLVDVVFSASASRDDQVPSGGRLMSFTFNKHDLLSMARRNVAEKFLEVMLGRPALGTEIVMKVLEQTVRKEHRQFSQPKHHFVFQFLGGTAQFDPDGSYIWTAGSHHAHDEWFMILAAFRKALKELANDSAQRSRLQVALEVLRDKNRLAVIWNAVLEAASDSPATLGLVVKELSWASAILGRPETRVAAGKFLGNLYSHLTREERRCVEDAILNLPQHTEPELAEFANERRDRMLGCIPVDLIETNAARPRAPNN